jgi:hypothetical protein
MNISKLVRFRRVLSICAVAFAAVLPVSYNFSHSSAQQAQTDESGSVVLIGTLSGRVFLDYNANGVYDTAAGLNSIDTGIAAVTVTAYDSAGAARGSAVTNSSGNYSISATGTGPYRLEFTNIPAGYYASARSTDSVLGGTASNAGSTVQFVADGNTSNINLALDRPEDFCQNNPEMVVARFAEVAQKGVYAGNAVLVNFPYSAGTIYTDTTVANYDNPLLHSITTTASQVGTVFSLAYSRATDRIYSAAFFKRHAGFGPGADGVFNNSDDPGAVYVVNRSTGSLASVFTVPNATSNSHNTADYGADNLDAGWDAVGKQGLGGMDLSDDGSLLFVMNLQDRKLYKLDASAGTNLGSTASITTLTLPTPGGTATNCSTTSSNTNKRPFAVNYYRGQVYIGVVCTAETNANASNLYAYIFQVDPGTLAITAAPIFSAHLNYTRGVADPTWPAEWQAWRTTITTDFASPQPMLTSIEFENDNLILGLRDRAGDQAFDNGADAKRTAGDTIRACGTFGAWTLESNGRCGGAGTAPQNTGQGVGNGEFYHQDDFCSAPNNGNYHDEIAWGAMVYIPGRQDVLTTVLDPINRQIYNGGTFDGGIRYFNNTTGAADRAYRLYDGNGGAGVPDFGKANGLGGVTALCDPAPIELGNRAWIDSNATGVQDPGENPVAGATVHLFSAAVQVATAVTDSSGEYYFVSSAAPDGNISDNIGQVNGGIQTGTAYQIRFDRLADFTSGGVLQGKTLTTANQTSQLGDDDSSDSDAVSVANPVGSPLGSFPVISVTTGPAGKSDHTLDAGFRLLPTAAGGSVSGRVLTANGMGIRNAAVSLTTMHGVSYSTLTGSFGFFQFNDVPVGEAVVVRVTAKRFTFAEPVRLLKLNDDLAGVDFIAEQ